MKKSQLITAMKNDVGKTKETTVRDWFNKTVANFGKGDWDWCAAYIAWRLGQLGVNLSQYRTANVGVMGDRAIAAKNFTKGFKGMQPGDIVIFDFPNTGYVRDHVAFCLTAPSGTTFTTVEGNVAKLDEYVRSKTRKTSEVHGYIRPKFDAETTTPPTTSTKYNLTVQLRRGSRGTAVKTLQQRLIALGYKLPKFGSDGVFGAETDTAVRSFQRAKKLVVDAIVGANTARALGWTWQGK